MSEIKLVHSKKTGLYAIIGEKEEITAIWCMAKLINEGMGDDE